MKRKTKLTLDKPNQIFTHANAQLPDDAKAYIASSDTCKGVLRRVRAQHRPREPPTLQELDIDGAWSMTTDDNPQPFLLHDNGSDADERVVIFAKEHHIQKLADSDVWCMDVTSQWHPVYLCNFMSSRVVFLECLFH